MEVDDCSDLNVVRCFFIAISYNNISLLLYFQTSLSTLKCYYSQSLGTAQTKQTINKDEKSYSSTKYNDSRDNVISRLI